VSGESRLHARETSAIAYLFDPSSNAFDTLSHPFDTLSNWLN